MRTIVEITPALSPHRDASPAERQYRQTDSRHDSDENI